MKKNLFDVEVVDELSDRLKKLSVNSKPQWGNMTAVEMMRHCTEAINLTLQTRPPSNHNSTFRQKLNKFLILHFIKKIPKGKQAPKQINMALRPFTLDTFENEQANYHEALQRFKTHKTPILNSHPYFGKMINKQWGIVTWMHLDHHMRQFGV